MGCSGGYGTGDYSFASYGGCFSGNGEVKLKDNTTKKIKELIKGDILENGAIVECLVIIKVNQIQKNENKEK